MCRLFGAISNHPFDAQDLLYGAPRSLFVQSRIDRKRPQGDGWGVGWFAKGKPHALKSSRPMYQERTLVQRAGKRARGRVIVGHVRWASNPLKLKRAELIGLPHTQPFVHGKWLFVHNGTLFIPKEVAAALGAWKKYLRGKNDSEVLFYWLLKHLQGKTNAAQAVRQAIQGIHRVWETCRKSYPIHKYPYHGLNFVLSDGNTFIVLCYTDPNGFGKAKALGNSQEPYYQLRRQVKDDHILVASQSIDPEEGWERFRHGELLIAKRRGKLVTAKKVQL
jgi:predicted glutamine amidotransferase